MERPSSFLSQWIRHLFTGWLIAAMTEFYLLPSHLRSLSSLEGLGAMSLPRLLLITAAVSVVLGLVSCWFDIAKAERRAMLTAFVLPAAICVFHNFSWAYLLFCLVISGILLWYCLKGHDPRQPPVTPRKSHWCFPVLTAVLAVLFVVIVSIWTVNRVRTLSTPTYDFGIFAQMFHNMKQTGLPTTTVERDGPLSHFAVHVSPIYYLLLPFYCLFPKPETLQILQAVVLASAVIPMWLIGKHRGLSGFLRFLLCGALLLLPTTAGGTSYDIHENCFLLPLILWLMYAIDKNNPWLAGLFGALTLAVKEDAAVYVAVAALYWILNTLLHPGKKNIRALVAGICLLAGAIAWFVAVTGYLVEHGDGVMTYRYQNFMYDGGNSLLSVVYAVLLCPLKMLYECADPEKNLYLLQTLVPLLFLPLMTRKYQRYLLLIPYILLNLMSDYTYQHDIFFQYNFGSSAFLLYLTAVNLADWKPVWLRFVATVATVGVCIGYFCSLIVPTAQYYNDLYRQYQGYYQGVHQALAQIPDDVSVATNTFYTTHFSDRTELYDVRYCDPEHMLQCQYVVLRCNAEGDYQKYLRYGDSGFDGICYYLEQNGYVQTGQYGSVFVIYQKSDR